MFRILTLGFAVLLSACVQSPPVGSAAVNTFAHVAPIDVAASNVSVTDEYTPPLKLPNIEHTLVNPPYRAAYNLARRTFNATGANDELAIVIRDAKIVRSLDVDSQTGNYSIWHDPTMDVYKGYVRADMILKQSVPPYGTLGNGEVKVNRTLKLPKTISLANRDIALNRMVEEMMADLHKGMIDVARNKFQIVLN